MDTNQINFSFNVVELTAMIDRLPNLYGKINGAGIFGEPQGVATTAVRIDIRDSFVRVLAQGDRDGKPAPGIPADDKAIYLEIPHIPYLDTIKPADIQNWTSSLSNPLRPKTLEECVAERLQTIRNSYGVTFEWMKLGALKGVILDGKGETLHDLFNVFDITKKQVNFALGTADTDVLKKTREVARHIEEKAMGEVVGGIHAEVAPEFFDALISHPNVEKFYVNWTASANFSGDMRRAFPFGSMVFSEYNGSLPMSDGTATRLIADGFGHAFPTGTMNTFKHFAGPTNRISGVNMPGPDIYVSPKVLDHDKGIELDCEANPLPICTRPEVLVELLQE